MTVKARNLILATIDLFLERVKAVFDLVLHDLVVRLHLLELLVDLSDL